MTWEFDEGTICQSEYNNHLMIELKDGTLIHAQYDKPLDDISASLVMNEFIECRKEK